jgi:hypothetical protein
MSPKPFLIAGATVPSTVSPPITGSMHDGNKLRAPVIRSDRNTGGKQATPKSRSRCLSSRGRLT